MDVTEVMSELERLGTEQNRQMYRRHGATDPLFGVSFAHLNALQKRIRRDHTLAEALWATGNADARSLAAAIADPGRFTREALEAWLDGLRSPLLVDLFVKHIASKTPLAREVMERWTASDDEWIGRAGWTLLGALAAEDPSLPDSLFEERLSAIEASIRRARNRAREAMNGALIRIGARNEPLRVRALAAARRIGKVEVDQGETRWTTPDAIAEIQKTWAARNVVAAPAAKPARAAGSKPPAKPAAAKPKATPAKPAVARSKARPATAKPGAAEPARPARPTKGAAEPATTARPTAPHEAAAKRGSSDSPRAGARRG